MPDNLRVLDMARLCGVCRDTILNYERRGIITSSRDVYNARRYSQAQLEKLRQLLGTRWINKTKESHN